MAEFTELNGKTGPELSRVAEIAEESSAVPAEATLGPGPTQARSGSGLAVFYSLIGRVGLLLLDSGTGILCARALRPEGRGELSAMILLPVFLSQAFTLGIPSALIYNLRRYRERVGPLVAAAIIIGSIMSAVVALLGIGILPFWLHRYSHDLVHHAQWFMLASVFSMAAMIFRGVWESMGGFGKSAGAQILSRVGTMSGLIVFLSLHRLTPFTAALCYVLSGVPPFLWTCIAIIPKARWQLQQIRESIRDLLSYGLRSYGIDLCGTLAQYVDQALVLGMLSASQMGTYTVALSLSRMLNIISVSLSAVLFPKSIGESPERVVRLAVRTLLGTLTLGILGALFILFFGTFMLNLLYGREYVTASATLKILTLEALISGSLTVLSQPFMAMGRPGTVTLLQVAGLLTSIPLLFVLVPRMGPEGASIALVCSACVRGLLLWISYGRIFPGNFHWPMVAEESVILVDRVKSVITQRFAPASGI